MLIFHSKMWFCQKGKMLDKINNITRILNPPATYDHRSYFFKTAQWNLNRSTIWNHFTHNVNVLNYLQQYILCVPDAICSMFIANVALRVNVIKFDTKFMIKNDFSIYHLWCQHKQSKFIKTHWGKKNNKLSALWFNLIFFAFIYRETV